MSPPVANDGAESTAQPSHIPLSLNTAFSDMGLTGLPGLSLDLSEAQRSSINRLQSKHTRSHTEGQDARRSIGKWSKLLGTVLGTPFPSSSSSPSTPMAADSYSRSASPSPSVDYTLVSAPSLTNTPQRHSVPLTTQSLRTVTPDNIATCSSRSIFFSSPSKKGPELISSLAPPPSPGKTGSQRILPRLWTALSSPTREVGIRLKRKGKGKAVDAEPYDDYPLDGEEGELVDDEACYVNIPTTIGLSLPPL